MQHINNIGQLDTNLNTANNSTSLKKPLDGYLNRERKFKIGEEAKSMQYFTPEPLDSRNGNQDAAEGVNFYGGGPLSNMQFNNQGMTPGLGATGLTAS